MLQRTVRYEVNEDIDGYLLLLLEKNHEKNFRSRNSVILLANVLTEGFYHKEMFTFTIAFERSRGLPSINATVRDKKKILSKYIKKNMKLVIKGRLKAKRKEMNFYYIKVEKLFFIDEKGGDLVSFTAEPYIEEQDQFEHEELFE